MAWREQPSGTGLDFDWDSDSRSDYATSAPRGARASTRRQQRQRQERAPKAGAMPRTSFLRRGRTGSLSRLQIAELVARHAMIGTINQHLAQRLLGGLLLAEITLNGGDV